MTDYSKLTDKQIAELLATKVMGWHKEIWDKLGQPVHYWFANGHIVIPCKEWHPCADLNQAVECAVVLWKTGNPCVELMIERPFVEGNDIEWRAYVDNGNRKWWEAINTSPARALCEAVLMAVE